MEHHVNYKYDRVFDQDEDQQNVFQFVQDCIENVL